MAKRMMRMGFLLACVGVGCGESNTAAPTVRTLPEFMDVSAASADLNGDGYSDLAVLTAPTNPEDERPAYVSVYYGPLNRNALPQASEHYDTASTASALTLGDVNRDGVPDVVVAQRLRGGNPIRYLGRVHVFYRAAAGGVIGEADRMLGADATSVALADIDGDGVLDLLATNPSYLYVARGLGGGDFEAPIHFGCSGVWTVRNTPTEGGADLVVTRWINPNVTDIIRWNGRDDPRTVSTMVFSQTVSSLAAADLNGDGKGDLLIGTSDGSTGSLIVALANDRSAIGSTSATELGMVLKMTTGDFNGDGIPDLCVSGLSPDGSVACLLGTGSGHFEVGGAAIPAASGSFLFSADLNGDGKVDLVLCDPSGRFSMPAGWFQP